MSSASPEPYMAQGTENRSADGGMSELSYGSAVPAGYGYGGDRQPQTDAALHWNIGADNRASVRFARRPCQQAALHSVQVPTIVPVMLLRLLLSHCVEAMCG